MKARSSTIARRSWPTENAEFHNRGECSNVSYYRRVFLLSNDSADETNRDSAVVVDATDYYSRLNVASRRFKKQPVKSFRYI